MAAYWPMAKTINDEILHTNYPRLSTQKAIEVVKTWEESNIIIEAWIDMCVNGDLEPVKRIPLVRDWKLGRMEILKKEEE